MRFIHKELEAESLPLDRLGALDPRSIALARTESRPGLGYMNEMARLCEYTVAAAGGLARGDAHALLSQLPELRLTLDQSAPPFLDTRDLEIGEGQSPG